MEISGLFILIKDCGRPWYFPDKRIFLTDRLIPFMNYATVFTFALYEF